MTVARENFSISLGSLEEAVRSLDEAVDSPTFATVGKKPAVPKKRPVSMTGRLNRARKVFWKFVIIHSHLYVITVAVVMKKSVLFCNGSEG